MGVSELKDLKETVKVKKPTVIREGDTVKECFMYKGMKECFEDRCFWKKNGECPISKALDEEPEEDEEKVEAW